VAVTHAVTARDRISTYISIRYHHGTVTPRSEFRSWPEKEELPAMTFDETFDFAGNLDPQERFGYIP